MGPDLDFHVLCRPLSLESSVRALAHTRHAPIISQLTLVQSRCRHTLQRYGHRPKHVSRGLTAEPYAPTLFETPAEGPGVNDPWPWQE
jgi:hypothetical protein